MPTTPSTKDAASALNPALIAYPQMSAKAGAYRKWFYCAKDDADTEDSTDRRRPGFSNHTNVFISLRLCEYTLKHHDSFC
ncbi:hypothetical protein PNOK_0969200 [Pyrrhoderma noxium]|uniref:Uncharacterized protein n=1 Tax=Pyrrhoderma noxium TaxID=2282107 RepID=A0A286U4X1_9AGAM|nr:hypothetical protein PNOK_0969200 [Pyrrhoderma noxium]